MAEAVTRQTEAKAAAPVAEQAPFFRPARGEVLVNQRRFGVAYLLLAIGVGVAVGLAIVLAGRGSSHHAAAPAQAFRPSASGELGAKQIALHVGDEYRLANGDQIAGIIGERPNYQNLPLFNYLIRPHDAQYPNDVEAFSVGNGIMYSMCGFATSSCGVRQTSSTTELLKREALELTLLTFKSDSSVSTVTTLMPPAQQTGVAVIFQRQQLASVLARPLQSVLPGHGPFKPGSTSATEQKRIDQLVGPALYTYDTQLGPDGNPILRLDPLG